MVQEYGEKLFLQLSDGLQSIDAQEPPMVVFRAQSRLVTGALRDLEAYRLAHPFDDMWLRFFTLKTCFRFSVRCNCISGMYISCG